MTPNTSVLLTPPTRSPGFARILAILPDYTESKMPANTLYCDNQGAIAMTGQPTYAVSGRSKHIDNIIRTKALPKELHLRHVKGLGMDRAPKGL